MHVTPIIRFGVDDSLPGDTTRRHVIENVVAAKDLPLHAAMAGVAGCCETSSQVGQFAHVAQSNEVIALFDRSHLCE